MNCSKCQGLCVEESSHDGSALRWEWKCLNCGKREPIQSAKIVLTPPTPNKVDLGDARLVSMTFKEKRMVSSRSEQRAERIDAEAQPFETGKACAATVGGGGTCKSSRIYGEKYCRRHLDKLNPPLKEKHGVTMPDFGKPAPFTVSDFGRSVPVQANQTESKVKMPGQDTEHWNTSVLSVLKEKRALIESKLAELDQAIALIEGL